MIGGLALAVALAVLLAGAAVAMRRAGRRERLARRDLLADCAALLENPVIEPDAAGYGVLKGRHGGRDVALRPFADTLTFRRLPQLWLAATVRTGPGGGPALEVMRRATGAEFYAAGDRLPARFAAAPPDWPVDVAIRGTADGAGLLPGLEKAIGPHLRDPRLKSVYVAHGGARAIRQVAEGARGAYLLFRDVRFGPARIAPHDAQAVLAVAMAAANARQPEEARDGALDEAAA